MDFKEAITIYRKENNGVISDLTPQEMANVLLVAKIARDARYGFSRMQVDGYEYIIQRGVIFEQIFNTEVERDGKRVKIQVKDRIVKI